MNVMFCLKERMKKKKKKTIVDVDVPIITCIHGLSLSLSELFLRVRWKRLHKVGEQDSYAATVVPEEEKILHIVVWCSSV